MDARTPRRARPLQPVLAYQQRTRSITGAFDVGIIRRRQSEEELREKQREEQRHQMNLQAAQAERPMDTAYIQQMTDHDLQEPTVDMLSNLLDQDFMLANLTEAEVHEYRWLARVMVLEIESLHPNEASVFQSKIRSTAFGNDNQLIEPLDARERAVIEQFIMGVISRATRGRNGWQQEMFNKTIQASETRQVNDDDDGGFL